MGAMGLDPLRVHYSILHYIFCYSKELCKRYVSFGGGFCSNEPSSIKRPIIYEAISHQSNKRTRQ